MKQSTINWPLILKLSGAYMAFLIGSGFATGQEVLQFFAAYGPWGVAGVGLTGSLFAIFGMIVMEKGRQLQLEKPGEIFSYYCGPVIGKLIEYFTTLFVFSVVVVMVAGAGAVVQEHFGLPLWVGLVGMGVVTMVTVLFGLTRVVDIIGLVGPVIVVYTVAISVLVFLKDPGAWRELGTLPEAARALQPASHWWQGAGLFFAYNALVGAVFYNELGQATSNRREAFLPAVIGSLGLTLSLLALVLAMFTHYDEVLVRDVPTLFLGDTISPLVSSVFSVCILLGIYSTAAPMYWMVQQEALQHVSTKWEVAVTVILGVLFMLGGTLPFSQLVAWIYPVVGYVGLAIVCVIFGRTLYDALKRSSIE